MSPPKSPFNVNHENVRKYSKINAISDFLSMDDTKTDYPPIPQHLEFVKSVNYNTIIDEKKKHEK